MASREFRPLLACSSLFWPLLGRWGVARIPAASGLFWPLLGGHLGCGPQRRTRWGGAFVWTPPLRFARIPLRFDAPAAVVSRRLFCGLFRLLLGEPLELRAAMAHAVGRGLRFDAPAVVSREFRCVSMLPLWCRADSGLVWPLQAASGRATLVVGRNGARGGAGPYSVAFRRSRCGFARIPLLGGPLMLRAATAHAVGWGLRFDATAVVSREFRCVSMLQLWFRANSVAFRCCRCGFARIPLRFDRANSCLFWPLLGAT